MASVVIGNDPERLAAFTKYPLAFVKAIALRMEEAELWIGEKIRCDRWNDPQGPDCSDIDFWMDALVAHGSWTRELDERGQYQYVQIGFEPDDLHDVH